MNAVRVVGDPNSRFRVGAVVLVYTGIGRLVIPAIVWLVH